jgi:hypothetical protein
VACFIFGPPVPYGNAKGSTALIGSSFSLAKLMSRILMILHGGMKRNSVHPQMCEWRVDFFCTVIIFVVLNNCR